MDVKVEVTGLNQLVRAFKQVDADIPKGLRVEMLGIARMVAGDIQRRVPHQSGRAARSVRPRASPRGAGIAFGGNAAPYYPWLDFGGSTGKGHRPGVGWSGSVERDMPDGGRYVYPTIKDNGPKIEQAAGDAVINAAKRAQFEAR
jgi:hypothetical protein